MRVYNLDGKVMPSLSKLVAGKSVRRVIEFKPGSHTLITRGRGVPGKNQPKRCLVCRRAIRPGQSWVSLFNGEYTVIRHSSCTNRKSVL